MPILPACMHERQPRQPKTQLNRALYIPCTGSAVRRCDLNMLLESVARTSAEPTHLTQITLCSIPCMGSAVRRRDLNMSVESVACTSAEPRHLITQTNAVLHTLYGISGKALQFKHANRVTCMHKRRTETLNNTDKPCAPYLARNRR